MKLPIPLLLSRMTSAGGFLSSEGGSVRPDSTAWALVILRHATPLLPSLRKSLDVLATFQLSDGRVCLSAQHSEVCWPTSLALLAWEGSVFHQANYKRAVHFLLNFTGKHWKKKPNSKVAHDPALRGWPWIENTHSWVEPTALASIALQRAGYANHSRLTEATEMLINRQLPHGGWNYGNTKVFGTELRPSPEDTGAALSVVVGKVSRSDVAPSLAYLQTEWPRLRTPIALGWSLLGLHAWGVTPPGMQDSIYDTLSRQQRFGEYDTSSLCILLAPLIAPQGLKALPRYKNAFFSDHTERMVSA